MPREQITHNRIEERSMPRRSYAGDQADAEIRDLLKHAEEEAAAAARAYEHIGEYATKSH
ncbi:hypothetical protein [Microbacterium resistens]|uniref:hypothetical protein n=1 Tax=Microbacterium resistens TaxID=156977 RepID=UPI00082BEA2E|nr:hypothetical protein [Microbacterium resistens]